MCLWVKNQSDNAAYEFALSSPALSRISFSSSIVCQMGGKWLNSSCFLENAAFRICWKSHATFLCSSHLAFFPQSVPLVSKGCNSTVEMTQSQLGRTLYQSSCQCTILLWQFFTGVLVTASLLKSPGLFSVFWLILIML